jgi:methionyl-tRNA formyltransferase
MRIVFLGTPTFAVPSLEALVRAGFEIPAVFTQPDRPKGRGAKLAESSIKAAATAFGLPVHQPERIRRPEQIEALRQLAPDLMVVVGYGQIIPQTIIDLPPLGVLNVHASLLPKYRGAAPIQWAIANGESETGVTIMRIDAGLDTGDMLLKVPAAIGPAATAPELSDRLAPLGAESLIQVTHQLRAGSVVAEPQDHSAATLAPILRKEDGLIDWRRSALVTHNRLRGFTPWPGAYTFFRGQQLNILSAKPRDLAGVQPGAIAVERQTLYVGCGANTALELLEVQLAGKKRMSAAAFVNGYRPREADTLGEQQ